jgi:hypothetical protein
MGKRSRTKRERKAQPAAKLSAFFDEARADFRSDFPPRNAVTVTAKYPGNIDWEAPPFLASTRALVAMGTEEYERVRERLRTPILTAPPYDTPREPRWDAYVANSEPLTPDMIRKAMNELRRRTSSLAVYAGPTPPAERWDSYVNPGAAWMLKSGTEIPVPTPLTHPRRFAFLRMTDIIAASPSPAIWYSIALVMREELKASEDPERWLPLKPFPDAKPAITSPNTLRAFVRRRVEALPEEAMVHLDRLLEGA